MQLYTLRIVSIVAAAFVYMMFDLFNKRNVPSLWAYATFMYGFALTLLYLNFMQIAVSLAVALIILGVGYVVYKIGQLGGADVIEFAALSLMLPVLGFPFVTSGISQYGIPFALSLLVNTGIVALAIVPLYYIPNAARKLKKPLSSYITRKSVFMASLMAVAYAAFIAFVLLEVGPNIAGVTVLAIMMASSFFIMLFSVPIMYSMIEYVGIGRFEAGDIIALNLMDARNVSRLRKRIRGFDRLVTTGTMRQMRRQKIKDKLPVYKNAMPFAVPIFIGVIMTLLFGNLIFFVLRI
ncbi:MAG: hypothetical protein ACREBH_01385 [Candidatus Micrarchaeaceae archaeon]